MRGEAAGHIVLVGALDRAQSLPLPVHFAATQGMLSAMAMALAKELGPLGHPRQHGGARRPRRRPLARASIAGLVATYESSARCAAPGHARGGGAKRSLWLALENTYMSGKVLSVNGGI